MMFTEMWLVNGPIFYPPIYPFLSKHCFLGTQKHWCLNSPRGNHIAISLTYLFLYLPESKKGRGFRSERTVSVKSGDRGKQMLICRGMNLQSSTLKDLQHNKLMINHISRYRPPVLRWWTGNFIRKTWHSRRRGCLRNLLVTNHRLNLLMVRFCLIIDILNLFRLNWYFCLIFDIWYLIF